MKSLKFILMATFATTALAQQDFRPVPKVGVPHGVTQTAAIAKSAWDVCPKKRNVKEVDASSEAAKVLVEQWAAAINRRDAKGAAGFFAPNAMVIHKEGDGQPKVLVDNVEIAAALQEKFSGNPTVSVQLYPLSVAVGCHRAVVFGALKGTLGSIEKEEQFTMTLAADRGKWVITDHHSIVTSSSEVAQVRK